MAVTSCRRGLVWDIALLVAAMVTYGVLHALGCFPVLWTDLLTAYRVPWLWPPTMVIAVANVPLSFLEGWIIGRLWRGSLRWWWAPPLPAHLLLVWLYLRVVLFFGMGGGPRLVYELCVLHGQWAYLVPVVAELVAALSAGLGLRWAQRRRPDVHDSCESDTSTK